MTDIIAGIPAVPFIPDQPVPQITRIVSEWIDRADLAAHAYLDGQWRVLTDYPTHQLLERWTAQPGAMLVQMELGILRKEKKL